MKPSLQGQKVVVYGLGKSGLAAIRLILREGAKPTGVDSRPEAELGAQAAELRIQGVELRLGAQPAPDAFEQADLLVVSPGVPLALPEIARARERRIPVWGEVELAWRFLEKAPVIGITGTNGKSTTTALTGELFVQEGRRTFIGGNLGRPLSEAPLEQPPFEGCVVELSSFQLEGIERMRVNAAAILNLTPDHIDRYPSQQAYGEAKARIFMNQKDRDVGVVNADDAMVVELARKARVPVYGFSTAATPPKLPHLAGLAVPEGSGFRFNFGTQPRFALQNRALRGAHNLQNAMAAGLLASLSGVSDAAIQRGLDSYPGLPHRLEYVRTLDGVEWINDSKATNVDSTLVALRAFPDGRLWLIAGGKGKGAPYAPMVEASLGKVLGVLTIGQDAPAIEEAYRGRIDVHPCGTLEQALRRARELAVEGDVVLLSPACASYDQFKNFEDRGETFKRLVRAF